MMGDDFVKLYAGVIIGMGLLMFALVYFGR